ncbi:MAG: phage tail protein [Bacteroidales bacterium]|jgi:hypothetical protein
MASIDIDSYRANFNGGAKAFMFYYKPIFPGEVTAVDTEKSTYLVRSTTLPETTIEEITTNWQGFDYRFAGKYTYSDWTVTFNCDSKSDVHVAFGDWMRMIHDPTSNIYTEPNTYMVEQELHLLGVDGLPIQKYKLYGAWPKSIGPITLDYATNDVCTFDITFSYVYHLSDKVGYATGGTFAG